ncbi:MAG: hypothetical protein NC340_03415 [Ruminococcus flavefaciens]|nr:hypothetical protein [Ruminococcus flavefaciens]MCM1229603.1 hypothetical protein [Ruminococcus flavefaciens]
MHRRFIYVPKTVADMKADWYGKEVPDVYEWELSDDEWNALWDCEVFDFFNELFEEFINDREDRIMYQYLCLEYNTIIESLEEYDCRSETEKLVEMIDRAIECRTYIGGLLI